MELFIFIAIGVVVIAVSKRRKGKTNDAWKEAARRLDLNFRPAQLFTQPKLTGISNSCSVLVETFGRGGGKSSSTYTRYRVGYARAVGLNLHLTRQGVFTGIGKLFGAQDIEIGDEEFDSTVVLRASDPNRAKKFLTPARRVRVAQFLNTYPGSVIYDNGVQWERQGIERDPEEIVRVLDRMTTLANHMIDDRDDHAALDVALQTRRKGRRDEPLDHLRGIPAREGSGAQDVPVPDGEIPRSPGESPEAAELFEEQPTGGITDERSEEPTARPDVEPMDTMSEKPAGEQADEPADPEAEERPEAALVAAESVEGPEVRAICEELFDPKSTSSKTAELYQARYHGRFVRWSGTLKNLRSYKSDLVFTDKPGTRAVFEIYTVDPGGYGGRVVQATVQLPTGVEKALESKVNRRLTFEGTLVSYDAFMQNLFVGDGKVCGEA